MIRTLARYILRDEIAVAQKQVERAEKMLANPLLTGIEIGNGSLEIGLDGGGASLLAGMFIGMLQDERAVNYIEVTFNSKEHGPIMVTVQKLNGKSPTTLLKECQAELAATKAAQQ